MNQMLNKQQTKTTPEEYRDLMYGKAGTAAALDEALFILDWDEMYKAVHLPAIAIMKGTGKNEGCDFAIFGAVRVRNGWKVRGIFYCAGADGFEGHLSRDLSTIKVDNWSVSVEPSDLQMSQNEINADFAGLYGPIDSSNNLRDASKVLNAILQGKSLGEALAEWRGDDYDLLDEPIVFGHVKGWYRVFRRAQAVREFGLSGTKIAPQIKEAIAHTNREIGHERARITRALRIPRSA